MKHSLDFPSSCLSLGAGRKIALIAIVFALSFPALLHAQAPKKVPFPFSPIGLNCLPWFVAKEARTFDKYGIDFDPVFIGASSALFNAMLSGAADLAGSGGPSVISNILQQAIWGQACVLTIWSIAVKVAFPLRDLDASHTKLTAG